MNLTQVEAFCTIAEYGSVSEAARQLDCNRTKLSMAIKALEKDLDVELFTRTGNQLTLSEAGKSHLQRLRKPARNRTTNQKDLRSSF